MHEQSCAAEFNTATGMKLVLRVSYNFLDTIHVNQHRFVELYTVVSSVPYNCICDETDFKLYLAENSAVNCLTPRCHSTLLAPN